MINKTEFALISTVTRCTLYISLPDNKNYKIVEYSAPRDEVFDKRKGEVAAQAQAHKVYHWYLDMYFRNEIEKQKRILKELELKQVKHLNAKKSISAFLQKI